jgi:hypothetical protein
LAQPGLRLVNGDLCLALRSKQLGGGQLNQHIARAQHGNSFSNGGAAVANLDGIGRCGTDGGADGRK